MNQHVKRLIPLLCILPLVLSGCSAAGVLPVASPQGISAPPAPPEHAASSYSHIADIPSAPPAEELPDLSGCEYIQNYYICSVIDDTLAQIITDNMTDYDKLLAVYRHLITTTAFFNEPVGTDIWRLRGDPDNLPTVYEIRSISPLLFGIGSCEDYASAFVTLCDRLGFAAVYVPGLTYSVEGVLVPHAWAMVKLDGVWYHADPQLEDNIIRYQHLRYRYFLKSDEVMQTDHRWGDLLVDPDDYALALPSCPETYEATPEETVTQELRPDRARILRRLAEEEGVYLAAHPPLSEYQPPALPE
ncbi:MAG: transglutaminase domain-containing protein [Acetanaerobacterium sp.]